MKKYTADDIRGLIAMREALLDEIRQASDVDDAQRKTIEALKDEIEKLTLDIWAQEQTIKRLQTKITELEKEKELDERVSALEAFYEN